MQICSFFFFFFTTFPLIPSLDSRFLFNYFLRIECKLKFDKNYIMDQTIIAYGYFIQYARKYDKSWIEFCKELSKKLRRCPNIQTKGEKCTISHIPEEVIREISFFFDHKSLCAVESVDKFWNKTVNSRPYWDQLLLLKYNIKPLNLIKGGHKVSSKSIFKEMHSKFHNLIYTNNFNMNKLYTVPRYMLFT